MCLGTVSASSERPTQHLRPAASGTVSSTIVGSRSDGAERGVNEDLESLRARVSRPSLTLAGRRRTDRCAHP